MLIFIKHWQIFHLAYFNSPVKNKDFFLKDKDFFNIWVQFLKHFKTLFELIKYLVGIKTSSYKFLQTV